MWKKYNAILQDEFKKEDDNLVLKENKDLEQKEEDDTKTPECIVLDRLGIKRYCCRRMFLCNKDFCEEI